MSIVVGVDNGPGGQLAVRWAVDEALLRRAALRVVHVSVGSDDEPAMPMAAGPLRAAAPGLRGYLDAMAYARDRLPDGTLSGIHPPGGPIHVLLEESADAELLVMGSRGRASLPTVLSSVSSSVAAHARPPTVVVHAGEDESVPRMHIAVGIDGSRHAAKALDFALAEARLRQTDVVEVRTDHDPADLLIEHTRTAELTVVGSRGHSGVAGVVIGSVSQAVLRHAHGPVAVVH